MLTRDLVKVLIIVFGLLAIAALSQHARSATTLLPNGEQCFQTGAGPVVSGSVNMYSVGTTTPKTTWTNSSQSATNTNPIQLDANGCAIIYGVGSYRQQLWSGPVVGGAATGNLIYDLTTADTSAFNSTFWAGTAGGTPNAITVTDAGFNNTDGSVINFLALNTNTGATTLNVSGGGAINIQQYTASGPAALTASCIVANNPVSVVYSSSAAAFLLLTPCPAGSTTIATARPGGYLTLSADINNIILFTDVSAATTVYYTPYTSNQVPIWNGSSYVLFNITQLSLTLTAGAHLASTIYDVFVFSNAGVATLVTGPAWANSGPGALQTTRGTGAGTTQISRVNGLWVNTVVMNGRNGATTYNSIPANQATYLGSIFIDTTPGQISNLISFGQSRKWGVWNAYNRQALELQTGDPTVGGWVYNSSTFRPSNNNSANVTTIFSGLIEENYQATFRQALGINSATGTTSQIGIGINSTTTPSAQTFLAQQQIANTSSVAVGFIGTTFLGIINVQTMEAGTGASNTQFYGTGSFMNMTVRWRG